MLKVINPKNIKCLHNFRLDTLLESVLADINRFCEQLSFSLTDHFRTQPAPPIIGSSASEVDRGPEQSAYLLRFAVSLFNSLPPWLVVDVPAHSLSDAGFEILFRTPSHFVLELGGIIRIEAIMARAVGDLKNR